MSTIPSQWQKFCTSPLSLRTCILIIGIAAAFTYLHTFANGFFYVDDEQFITQNIVVTGGAPAFHALFPAANAPFLVYIPLTMLSWRLTWLLGDGSPVLFHLIDLLLHIGCAALVCWIIDRLTGKRWAALMAGLAFAVHPLTAEAVVWATQRKDILSALFALLSFAAYIRHAEDDDRKLWLIASIVAYLCGLLAKVGIAPLPMVFLLFDRVAGRRGAVKMLIEKAWFVFAAVPIVMINLSVGKSFVGVIGLSTTLHLGAKNVASLLALSILPWTLSSLRWQSDGVSIADPLIILSMLTVIALCMFMIVLMRKRSEFAVAGFGLAWFLLFLLPTFPSALKAGLLYYTSEKYAYLPLVGLLLTASVLLIALLDRRPKLRAWIVGASGLVLVLFAIRTFLYVPMWKDMETYSSYIVQNDPGNPHALANLGLAAERRNDLAAARGFYERALNADPGDITQYLNAASLASTQGRNDDMRTILRSLIPAMTERQLRGDVRLPEAVLKAALRAAELKDDKLASELVQRLAMLVPDNALVREVLTKLR